uniref:Cytochrome P450 4c3 n=1 Tax=Rhabditophanes sp. KR3021 TaxID=114890 RepID=A0AC35TWC5_9BILA
MWLGPQPIVMIYCAEVIEKLFTGGKNLGKGHLYKFLLPWLGLGLLTYKPDKWRPRRKLLTPTFHYDILKSFVYIFNTQSEILTGRLDEFFCGGRRAIVDAGHWVTLCALDIICESSMGQCVGAQLNEDSDYVKAVHTVNDIIQRRQLNPFMWSDFVFKYFGEGREHVKAIETLHGFRSKVIAERREQIRVDGGLRVNQKCNFLDLMLEMEKNGELTLDDISSEVDIFMFEGHDTTATGLTWAIQLLGCHPGIQEKVRGEIQAVVGNDPSDITFEQLGRLKYLECCLKESLRLYPSVPIYNRVLDQDEVVDDKIIPRGTEILINAYLMHRDAKYWPDPEAFRPERFTVEEANGRHPYAYLPFSAGSRNCIGQRFALMEEKTVLVHLLSKFNIRSLKRMDEIRCKTELILRPDEPIMVELTLIK